MWEMEPTGGETNIWYVHIIHYTVYTIIHYTSAAEPGWFTGYSNPSVTNDNFTVRSANIVISF